MEKSDWEAFTVDYIDEIDRMESLLDLKGKTAVITGGAGSFGFLLANRLTEAGASVVLLDVDDARGQWAVEALQSRGRKALFHHADVTSREDMDAAMNFALSQFGSLDIAVANAGVWSYQYSLDMPEEVWQRTARINFDGTFHTLTAAGRVMRDQGTGGKLLTIGSAAALNAEPPFGLLNHYAATKGGAIAFTKSFAREVKKYGINVNAICPGSMCSVGIQINDNGFEDHVEELTRVITPSAKTPDDVVRVAFMMCTPIADYMYGAVIPVDGGAHIFMQE